MTNEEKAKEIGLLNARQYRHNYGSEELTNSVNECIQSCIEMAEWKDKQYSEIIKEECNASYESGLAEGERKVEARVKEILENSIEYYKNSNEKFFAIEIRMLELVKDELFKEE